MFNDETARPIQDSGAPIPPPLLPPPAHGHAPGKIKVSKLNSWNLNKNIFFKSKSKDLNEIQRI